MGLSIDKFQSTLPSRGATVAQGGELLQYPPISIHAPLAGSDGADYNVETFLYAFQSTLPSRGATCQAVPSLRISRYFNPRSPRGERPVFNLALFILDAFQSTLPSRGATPLCALMRAATIFQSTLPSRGATRARWVKITNLSFQSTLPSRGATAKMHKTSQQYCQLHPKTVLHAACMRL